MRGQRYLALDGLRGFAAMAVVLMHARIGALHGYLAVDLFFILSGFVISASYEEKLASGRMAFLQYARIRLERLYPMLFLGGAIGLVVFAMGWSSFEPASQADLALAIVSQFLLIPFLSSSPGFFAFNNPQWSIVWELVANGLHAAALPRLSNRVLWAIVGLSALALLLMAFRLPSLSAGWGRSDWAAGLPRVGFGFFAGILLHRTRERWRHRMPRVNFVIPALLFMLLVSAPPQWIAPGTAFALYDVALITLCFVPLVMLAVNAEAGPAAQALGTMSYPLYAMNEPLLTHLDKAGAGDLARVAAIAALGLLAWAIGAWIDEPLNRWRRRNRSESSTAVPVPSPVAG